MKNNDMDCIIRFALASSATVIMACCATGCLYGPPPSPSAPWDGGQNTNLVGEIEIENEE